MATSSRSLADDIRGRSDAELIDLVLARPDLARPAPADLTSLAARAGTRASVQRAVEALDRGHLQVLEAVVVAGDAADASALLHLLGTDDATTVDAIVQDLWRAALLWRGADGDHVVRTVPEVLGTSVAGLGAPMRELRPSSPPEHADPDRIRADHRRGARRLARDARADDVGAGLRRAADGARPDARRPAGCSSTTCSSPSRPTASRCPARSGSCCGDGRLHRSAELTPPDIEARTRLARRRRRRRCRERVPHPRRRARRRRGAPSRPACCAPAACRSVTSGSPSWRSTSTPSTPPSSSSWRMPPASSPTTARSCRCGRPPRRSTSGARARPGTGGRRWPWPGSARPAHRTSSVGAARGTGPPTPSARTCSGRRSGRSGARCCASWPRSQPGSAPDRGSLRERLAWRRPNRSAAVLDEAVEAVLREAEWLGVTGRGALSEAGRALLAVPRRGRRRGGRPWRRTCPRPSTTSSCRPTSPPSPPGRSWAASARSCASPPTSSPAAAPPSTASRPSRCAGPWTPGGPPPSFTETVRRSSRTPVPQPLEYLVADVARRHGQTRIGGAAAYIRSDDEAVLDTMLAVRDLAPLRLRRLAPTVLVSSADPRVLVDLLRDNGFAPVHEGQDGTVVARRDTAPRAGVTRAAAPARGLARSTGAYTQTLVDGLRAAEATADQRRAEDETRPGPRIPATDPVVTLSLLRDAVADQHGVWIGYSDGHGATSRAPHPPPAGRGRPGPGHRRRPGTSGPSRSTASPARRSRAERPWQATDARGGQPAGIRAPRPPEAAAALRPAARGGRRAALVGGAQGTADDEPARPPGRRGRRPRHGPPRPTPTSTSRSPTPAGGRRSRATTTGSSSCSTGRTGRAATP